MSSSSPFFEKLSQFFGHPMTEGQRHCVSELELFLRDHHPYPVFLLSGYAGTGKTSLLGATIKTLQSYKVPTRLLAPTGKAAKVLSQNAGKSAFTIHKMIYRRKNKLDDFNTIELAPNLSKNTVFIVDEASMIGDYTLSKDGNVNQRNLLEDLIEYVYSGNGCRMILLGDTGQLPPVGSDYSPALYRDYLLQHFASLKIFEAALHEVVRQDSLSGILANATHVRAMGSQFPTLQPIGFDDVESIDGVEFQDRLESSYSRPGMEETIVITRSNKRANEYNNQIRARILWFEEKLCSNDILMVVKNNYHWLKDEPDMGFIANGETLVVKRVVKFEEVYGFEFARLLVTFPDYPNIGEHEVLVHTESLQSDGPSLSRQRMKELFFEVEKDYFHEANRKKRYELILANPYFNALQVKFAYAVTCHKSQGGQWDHVFIDVGYIPEDSSPEEYNRWLYTAITRAKVQLFLVNFPEEQLHSGN